MKRLFLCGMVSIILGCLRLFSLNACEPCVHMDFDKTQQAAELIIIGQRSGEGPRSDFGEGFGGPDWIEVKVHQVLKGEVTEGNILVNSWDGMCDYGMVIDDKNLYVLFLVKRKVSDEDYQYDAVNYGCAVKNYLFKDGNVVMPEKEVPLEEFRLLLK